MLEIGPKHSLDYRQEVLSTLFGKILSTESCYVIGAPGAGKTRLLDFMMDPRVQKQYFGDQEAEKTWLIRVDMNRLAHLDQEWEFYELLLSSIPLGIMQKENISEIYTMLADMDTQVIESKDLVRALRSFERMVTFLCQKQKLRLCFLFDEFDETYQRLPRETFAQLRGVRDANKNRMCYVLFLRKLPEELRPGIDNESFYELLSRNMVGVGPYARPDALVIVQQLEARRGHPLTPEMRERIVQLSGGHAGYIQALVGLIIDDPAAAAQIAGPAALDWLCKQPTVIEESRKLREGLSPREQDTLKAFALADYGGLPMEAMKVLLAKGLLRQEPDEVCFFTPLFERYMLGYTEQPAA